MPRLIVVCRQFGATSEVWIRRQIQNFTRLETSVMTWTAHGAPGTMEVPVHRLPVDFKDSGPSWLRWPRRLRNLHTGNLLRPGAREFRATLDHLRREKPDVILAHFGHIALRILPAARELGIPVVAHFHGLDLSSSLRDRYYRFSLHRQARHFAHCIVVGSHQQPILEAAGVEASRISRIPCGAPVEQFQPRPDDYDDTCTFVAVSRLVAWKGLKQTVQAFQLALEKRPALRLRVIGDGPDLTALRTLAAREVASGAITFLGPQPATIVAAEMQRANAFVQHSLDYSNGWNEGFGVSITEASATALPVIVTRCGGIPDQVIDGKTGFLVKQNDLREYAEAMVRVADDPVLRRSLGRAGRNNAEAHFDSLQLSRALEDVLLRAAKP